MTPLIGGAGNDIYMFGIGSGRDEIIDNNKGVFDASTKDVLRVLSGSYAWTTWVYTNSGKNGDHYLPNNMVTYTSISVSDYDNILIEQAHADAGNDIDCHGRRHHAR